MSVSPSAEIVEGSSVTLTCSSDANPAANYTWYKEKQEVFHGQEGSYHFSSISSVDRGNYSCKSENQHGRLISESVVIDVQCEYETLMLLLVEQWIYKKGLVGWLVLLEKWIHDRDRGTQRMSCAFKCTITKPVLVHNMLHNELSPPDGPRLPSVSVSPSAEIVEGSSVTLTCSSDANPAANYTWYKENEDSPKASGQIFTITDFRAEHSGNYSCEAQNRRGRNKTSVHLTVAGEFPFTSHKTLQQMYNNAGGGKLVRIKSALDHE